MKTVLKSLMVGLLMVIAVGCGGGSDSSTNASTVRLNMGIDSSEDAVTYLYVKKFSELLEEKSGGDITSMIHVNGSMGSDREMVESLQAGSLDIAVMTTAPQVNFMPKLAVFDLPAVFANVEVARKALDNPEFNGKVEKIYADAGITLLGIADQGFRTMSSNVKVQSMADMKGIKIRTMENPYHLNYWKSVGANPTPMAFSELYIGLQQGMVDAQENPYETIVSNKLYEQQKYVIKTNHLLHSLTLVMSSIKFDTLSDENKAVFREAATEAKAYARRMTDERVSDRVKIMEDYGVEILDLDQSVLDEMASSASGVYDDIRKAVGDDLVNSLLDAVNN